MWDANDWRTGPSATSPVPALPPTSGDVLYFTNLASNADCPLVPLPSWWVSNGVPGGTVPQVGQFYGVNVTDNYSGVVDFRCSAFVGGLSVNSGTVRQSDPNSSTHGGQSTVQMGFSWTGGTINDSSLPGFLNLAPMAQGTIAPTNGSTVNLGSTVTLFGHEFAPIGSVLTVLSGIIKVNRGDGFVVNMKCNMLVQPKAEEDTSAVDPKVTLDGGPATPVAGILTVKPGGKLIVKAKDRPANNVQPANFVVDGANARVNNLGVVEVSDRSFITVSNSGAVGYDQDQANATDTVRTKLEAGCGITCTQSSYVRIGKGTLELAERRGAGGVPEDDQPKILITGTANANWVLRIQQDATLKRADAAPKVPLYLEIQGAVKSFTIDGTVELYAVKD